MPWADKYAPKSLKEVEGNPSALDAVSKWADGWKPGRKPLLLVGTPGSGKTATALALALESDWELLEMNASDKRNKISIERIAGLASVSTTLSGKKRLILIDEVDGFFRADYGGSSALLKVLREAQNPVILTANEYYTQSLASIRKECDKVEFKKVHYATIKKVLARIAKAEGIDASEEALLRIAKSVGGDLKSAINDFQAAAQGRNKLDEKDVSVVGARDRKENIFNAMRTIFKSTDIKEAKRAFDSVDEDYDMFMKWVDENVPREYEKPEDMHAAFKALSRADIFQARIMRRQNWSLLKFVIFMMTAGIAAAKTETYHSFTPYQFPTVIRNLSQSKAKRAIRNSIAGKIGRVIHASKKEVITEHLPFLEALFADKETAAELAMAFDLDAKELQYFGITEAKAKKIEEQSRELREKEIKAHMTSTEKQKSLAHFS
ncbi:MAG: replication factor C large subunit [Candidatus Diapherotrites archaeon]|nr:replication factor C large subunit [Candidatus Diapherotrites archaeon]